MSEKRDLKCVKIEHLRRIATALADSLPLKKMAEVVANECKSALEADAISVHVLMPDGTFEMMAAIGCSEEYLRNWSRVPKNSVAFASVKISSDKIFFANAEKFKEHVPSLSGLVDRSPRKLIAYAPLFVNHQSIGVIGFSYNKNRSLKTKENFISILVNLCAQALERARLTEQEIRAREAAEAANRAKTDFLANMSHEIRTPLGIVQGYADLLADSNLPQEIKPWVDTIRRNTNQLANIIGDVLDISKIEAKKVEIGCENFSLPDLLADVAEAAAFRAQSKDLKFFYSFEPLPAVVQGDPIRLRQIIDNLISNALKFTPEGQVSLQAKFTHPNLLEIDVVDTGIGIARENWEKIFEPFIQADSSTSRQFGGTGLGLTISKRLAQGMGGSLEVGESQPGYGSTFRLKAKCESIAYRITESQKISFLDFPQGEPNLQGSCILVVEDSPDNRDLIGLILSREGANVEFAEDAETGIQRALRGRYDVVLMDIQMPGLNGYEAIEKLRRSGYKGVVAALSARALKSDIEEGKSKGFDDYFTKPIDRPVLIRRLSRLRFAGGHLH